MILKNVYALSSLEGLHNIDYQTLKEVRIESVEDLSFCNVKSICDYLQTGKDATISLNKIGCNSTDEVLASCTTTSNKEELIIDLRLYPNPVSNILHIKPPISLAISIFF